MTLLGTMLLLITCNQTLGGVNVQAEKRETGINNEGDQMTNFP